MGIHSDITTFITSKDVVVFAVTIAVSTQIQALLTSLINNIAMPVVSLATGNTNLATRSFYIRKPQPDAKPPRAGIEIAYGAALNQLIIFLISLVILVEFAKAVSAKVPSSSVQWKK